MPDLYFPLGAGLTDSMESVGFGLGEESYNFWIDREGYLVNYPGKTDIFLRPSGDWPVYLSVPPLMNEKITRIKVFTDYLGNEHIVFVRKDKLCVVNGNGYDILYTFVGDSDGDYYFPSMFVHESKLIIANFGDIVLIWDGVKKVNPLGVHEIPQPPDLRSHAAPGMELDSGATGAAEYGFWSWYGFWWPQEMPLSGPSENVNTDGDKISGLYRIVAQYEDEYGNKGRVSPPSNIVSVLKRREIGTLTMTHPYNSVHFLISSWLPPAIEDHIFYVALGRTANLDSEDAQGGDYAYDSFYHEKTIDNVTECRYVHQLMDTDIIANGPFDMTVGPPPQASIGCSWKSRVLLAGLDDENLVIWSDTGKFGQFRATNQYRAVAPVKCVIPVEDRVVIISATSTEVLYESNGSMAILGQDFANGSMYGRSFVDVGGSIFGLWNNGFGYYDGEKFEFVDTPYYIKSIYVDRRHYVHSAVNWNEWYILSVRTMDATSQDNNKIVLYNFATKMWYIIKESVFDLAHWDGVFLGVYDSIYEMFKGPYAGDCSISVQGLLPKEVSDVIQKRSILGVALLMESSSSAKVSVDLRDMLGAEHDETDTVAMPSRQAISMVDGSEPVWDDSRTVLKYSSRIKWNAPGDNWIKLPMHKPVTSYAHKLTIAFEGGHRVRIKGLMLTISDSQDGV